MKRFAIRTLKFIGILVGVTLLSAFVWANWEEPSPGMRATVVDFLQYDMSKIPSNVTPQEIEKAAKRMNGVQTTSYNASSKLLVVSYKIEETDKETVETTLNEQFNIELKNKVFVKSGPKCPIDVAYISKVKKFLCVRD